MNDPYQWKKFKRLSLSNGICYGTYAARVKRQGMSPEEAATKPVEDRRERMIALLKNGILKAAPNKEGERKYEA